MTLKIGYAVIHIIIDPQFLTRKYFRIFSGLLKILNNVKTKLMTLIKLY